ncbi:MAG: DMT family transporter [Aestuariivirga sp.]|uniref:DMT family transporter n=1 Tax=Aestuariivirga sp. TaxID=2650926 RepID=UPI0038D0801E
MNPRVTGILLMTASMAVFTSLDTAAKFVTQDLPPAVAVFGRYAVAFLISLAVMLRAGGASLLITHHPFLQAFRGVLLMVSTILNFMAMMHLQLAQTSAIFFTIPLWVCVLSVPLLGEHVGWRRWAAVAAGFLGVLVIMRPGTDSFHWAMLMSIASSFCGAVYNIVTRKVGGRDRTETSLFYVSFVGALAAAAPLPVFWQTPVGIQWLLLIFMGVTGAVGHLMLIQAHRLAPASALAPFLYTQIVWMIAAGFIFFGDVPDIWTLAGAAIVVVSGLVVFASEASAGRMREVPAPAD